MTTGETLISLERQKGNPANPLVDVHIPACSAQRFRLVGLATPPSEEGGVEAAIAVVAVNASGTEMTVAADRDGRDYIAEFPASHFDHSGAVTNGFKVNIVCDGATFRAATGNLVIEAQDANVTEDTPLAHLVTKETLAAIADDLELADAATQKEVRVSLQAIIARLKSIASTACLALAVAAAGSASAVPSETLWEDMPPTCVVAQVVRDFAPPAPSVDLTPATNYTDIVAASLSSRLSSASRAATNYTDRAIATATNGLITLAAVTNETVAVKAGWEYFSLVPNSVITNMEAEADVGNGWDTSKCYILVEYPPQLDENPDSTWSITFQYVIYKYYDNPVTTGWVEDERGWPAQYGSISDEAHASGTYSFNVENKIVYSHGRVISEGGKNVLGFAYLDDVPSTNGFVTATITNGLVTASITNGLATKAYTDAAIAAIPSGTPEWEVKTLVSNVAYVTNGMAQVSVASGGTLGAVTTGWPDGAAVFVRVSAPLSYTVSGIQLIGYGSWPTNNFSGVCWRSGTNVFCNVLTIGD